MSGASRIVIESRPGEVRAAAVDAKGQPLAFRVERGTARSRVGGIYLGRVLAVRPELGAAFIDIGLDADGFLNIKGNATDAAGTPIVEGAQILVQLTRDAAGSKGPAVSTGLDVAGAALVLTPGRPGLGLSGRLSDEAVRTRLKELFAGQDFSTQGLVVRTAARDLDDAALEAEWASLQDRWQELLEAVRQKTAPATIQMAPGLAERMLSQFAGPATQRIIVDDADMLVRLRTYIGSALRMSLPAPVLAEGGAPAFAAAGLSEAFEEALCPYLSLPSGGGLIISETPAMAAVDVNAGRTAGGKPERLALETNLEAATALARALRVRGIGGLIAVDFLKMREDANRKRVLAALSKAFKDDPDSPRAGGFSAFGLVDIVRRSQGTSLAGALLANASVLSAESAAIEALARIQRRGGSGAVLRADPSVCACLDGPLLEIRKTLEQKLGFVIRLEPVPGAGTETLEIESPR